MKNRAQMVRVGGVLSAERVIDVGVGGALSTERVIDVDIPQGPVLGPILFLIMKLLYIYINDLPSNKRSENYTFFADDTTISLSAGSLIEAMDGLRDAQAVAKVWFDTNKLLLNENKTKRVVFSTRDK